MTPTTLTLIAVDGTVTTHTPKGRAWTLEELQALVGGYIETFNVAPGIVAVFDEDGKPRGLPENPVASAACAFTVVGPCLLGTASAVRGGKTGGPDVLQAIQGIVAEAAETVRTAYDTFLHDLFVTALEGGIGYWSTCSRYRWAKPDGDPQNPVSDLVGFHAVIEETEDDDKPEHRIDRDLIIKGLAGLKDALGEDSERYQRIKAAEKARDCGQLDAEDADVVVQVGLFNDIVYG